MAALLPDERQMMVSNLRAFLADSADEAVVRRLMETASGVDLPVWHRLADELGLAAMLVPEACSGLDLGIADALLTVEQAAYALYSGPLLSSAVLAPMALRAAGDADAVAPYLMALADGRQLMTLAIEEPDGQSVQARKAGDGWLLDGVKTAVINAGHADLILATAVDESGATGLFVVDSGKASVDIRPLDVFDRTRRQFVVTCNGAIALRLGGDFSAAAELLGDVAAAAAVAEQVGIAQHSLDVAVAHAKVREQFGRQIGSFQAVKHLCADMLARVECMRAAARAAAHALDHEDPHHRAETVSVAKAYASGGAIFVAESAIQILGGIGCSWEHSAHLYLRRAWSLASAFGDAAHHRARIAALAGLERRVE